MNSKSNRSRARIQKPATKKEETSVQSVGELLAQLDTSNNGLSQSEAQSRLSDYGYNELTEKKVSALKQFFSHFWGPIPWMIEAAVLLSGIVGDWIDFSIIMVLLVANGIVGFWEEFEAGNAVAALKAQLALKALAKRDGKWTKIPARELVPGDIILLKIGNVLPADARLLEGDSVEVDQAALTGESLPVTRQSGDEVYSGSILKRGEIEGVVYATGADTFLGKAAQLVESAETVSHFQKAVLKIGDYLIVIALVLVFTILIVRIWSGDHPIKLLKFCLVLTVASIPVAMPTVLSITMAAGAQALAKKQAIVTRLASIEELAGIDIICSDKTGTLTLNQLTLGEPVTQKGISSDEIILTAALASSRQENLDPIDSVILNSLKDRTQLNAYQLLHFTPFDPVSKRTEATVRGADGKTFKISKGAPQAILNLASDRTEIEDTVNQTIAEFARRGFRALGVARTDEREQWQFLGILPMFDPPRSDSQLTIQEARKLGVRIKMLTGDQVAIAKETCRQLGLGENILDAELFRQTPASQMGQLAEQIEGADGFGQVFPEDKYHIVEVLQQRNHIIGMTGDGVNDAPALKKADAGIAVSGATDAARAAADIVLLAPGLSVIIDAIRLSRQIFERMNSYTIYRIVETIRVLLLTTLAILIFDFYPVTAIAIVLLALLNDGAILSIAYDNARTARSPQAWNMPVVLGMATTLGLAGVIETFLLFYLAEVLFHLDRGTIQTLIYLNLAVGGMMTLYVTRTRGPFWSVKPAKLVLVATVAATLISTLMSLFGILIPAIGWGWTLASWGYAFVWFLIFDRLKLALYPIFDRQQLVLKSKGLKRWIKRISQ
jgi:H+-transporting ATPase